MLPEVENSDKSRALEEQKMNLQPSDTPEKKRATFDDFAGGVAKVMGFVEKFVPIVKNAINDIDDIRSVIKTGQPANRQRFQVGGSQPMQGSNYISYSRSAVSQSPSYMNRMPEVAPVNGNMRGFQTWEQANNFLAILKNRLERQTNHNGVNFISLYDEYVDAGLQSMAQPPFYNWGWYDLRGADIRQVGDGTWELIMPTIKLL